ncbi:transforming acidic coiled-coil-containing protein 2 [Lissotriton helveticus]
MGSESSKPDAKVSSVVPDPTPEPGTPLGDRWKHRELAFQDSETERDSPPADGKNPRDPPPLESGREADTPFRDREKHLKTLPPALREESDNIPWNRRNQLDPYPLAPGTELDLSVWDGGKQRDPCPPQPRVRAPHPSKKAEDPWDWDQVGPDGQFISGQTLSIPAFLLQGEDCSGAGGSSSGSSSEGNSTSKLVSHEGQLAPGSEDLHGAASAPSSTARDAHPGPGVASQAAPGPTRHTEDPEEWSGTHKPSPEMHGEDEAPTSPAMPSAHPAAEPAAPGTMLGPSSQTCASGEPAPFTGTSGSLEITQDGQTTPMDQSMGSPAAPAPTGNHSEAQGIPRPLAEVRPVAEVRYMAEVRPTQDTAQAGRGRGGQPQPREQLPTREQPAWGPAGDQVPTGETLPAPRGGRKATAGLDAAQTADGAGEPPRSQAALIRRQKTAGPARDKQAGLGTVTRLNEGNECGEGVDAAVGLGPREAGTSEKESRPVSPGAPPRPADTPGGTKMDNGRDARPVGPGTQSFFAGLFPETADILEAVTIKKRMEVCPRMQGHSSDPGSVSPQLPMIPRDPAELALDLACPEGSPHNSRDGSLHQTGLPPYPTGLPSHPTGPKIHEAGLLPHQADANPPLAGAESLSPLPRGLCPPPPGFFIDPAGLPLDPDVCKPHLEGLQPQMAENCPLLPGPHPAGFIIDPAGLPLDPVVLDGPRSHMAGLPSVSTDLHPYPAGFQGAGDPLQRDRRPSDGQIQDLRGSEDGDIPMKMFAHVLDDHGGKEMLVHPQPMSVSLVEQKASGGQASEKGLNDPSKNSIQQRTLEETLKHEPEGSTTEEGSCSAWTEMGELPPGELLDAKRVPWHTKDSQNTRKKIRYGVLGDCEQTGRSLTQEGSTLKMCDLAGEQSKQPGENPHSISDFGVNSEQEHGSKTISSEQCKPESKEDAKNRPWGLSVGVSERIEGEGQIHQTLGERQTRPSGEEAVVASELNPPVDKAHATTSKLHQPSDKGLATVSGEEYDTGLGLQQRTGDRSATAAERRHAMDPEKGHIKASGLHPPPEHEHAIASTLLTESGHGTASKFQIPPEEAYAGPSDHHSPGQEHAQASEIHPSSDKEHATTSERNLPLHKGHAMAPEERNATVPGQVLITVLGEGHGTALGEGHVTIPGEEQAAASGEGQTAAIGEVQFQASQFNMLQGKGYVTTPKLLVPSDEGLQQLSGEGQTLTLKKGNDVAMKQGDTDSELQPPTRNIHGTASKVHLTREEKHIVPSNFNPPANEKHLRASGAEKAASAAKLLPMASGKGCEIASDVHPPSEEGNPKPSEHHRWPLERHAMASEEVCAKASELHPPPVNDHATASELAPPSAKKQATASERHPHTEEGHGRPAGEGKAPDSVMEHKKESGLPLPSVERQATASREEPGKGAEPGKLTVPGQDTVLRQDAVTGQLTVPGQDRALEEFTVHGQGTVPGQFTVLRQDTSLRQNTVPVQDAAPGKEMELGHLTLLGQDVTPRLGTAPGENRALEEGKAHGQVTGLGQDTTAVGYDRVPVQGTAPEKTTEGQDLEVGHEKGLGQDTVPRKSTVLGKDREPREGALTRLDTVPEQGNTVLGQGDTGSCGSQNPGAGLIQEAGGSQESTTPATLVPLQMSESTPSQDLIPEEASRLTVPEVPRGPTCSPDLLLPAPRDAASEGDWLGTSSTHTGQAGEPTLGRPQEDPLRPEVLLPQGDGAPSAETHQPDLERCTEPLDTHEAFAPRGNKGPPVCGEGEQMKGSFQDKCLAMQTDELSAHAADDESHQGKPEVQGEASRAGQQGMPLLHTLPAAPHVGAIGALQSSLSDKECPAPMEAHVEGKPGPGIPESSAPDESSVGTIPTNAMVESPSSPPPHEDHPSHPLVPPPALSEVLAFTVHHDNRLPGNLGSDITLLGDTHNPSKGTVFTLLQDNQPPGVHDHHRTLQGDPTEPLLFVGDAKEGLSNRDERTDAPAQADEPRQSAAGSDGTSGGLVSRDKSFLEGSTKVSSMPTSPSGTVKSQQTCSPARHVENICETLMVTPSRGSLSDGDSRPRHESPAEPMKPPEVSTDATGRATDRVEELPSPNKSTSPGSSTSLLQPVWELSGLLSSTKSEAGRRGPTENIFRERLAVDLTSFSDHMESIFFPGKESPESLNKAEHESRKATEGALKKHSQDVRSDLGNAKDGYNGDKELLGLPRDHSLSETFSFSVPGLVSGDTVAFSEQARWTSSPTSAPEDIILNKNTLNPQPPSLVCQYLKKEPHKAASEEQLTTKGEGQADLLEPLSPPCNAGGEEQRSVEKPREIENNLCTPAAALQMGEIVTEKKEGDKMSGPNSGAIAESVPVVKPGHGEEIEAWSSDLNQVLFPDGSSEDASSVAGPKPEHPSSAPSIAQDEGLPHGSHSEQRIGRDGAGGPSCRLHEFARHLTPDTSMNKDVEGAPSEGHSQCSRDSSITHVNGINPSLDVSAVADSGGLCDVILFEKDQMVLTKSKPPAEPQIDAQLGEGDSRAEIHVEPRNGDEKALKQDYNLVTVRDDMAGTGHGKVYPTDALMDETAETSLEGALSYSKAGPDPKDVSVLGIISGGGAGGSPTGNSIMAGALVDGGAETCLKGDCKPSTLTKDLAGTLLCTLMGDHSGATSDTDPVLDTVSDTKAWTRAEGDSIPGLQRDETKDRTEAVFGAFIMADSGPPCGSLNGNAVKTDDLCSGVLAMHGSGDDGGSFKMESLDTPSLVTHAVNMKSASLLVPGEEVTLPGPPGVDLSSPSAEGVEVPVDVLKGEGKLAPHLRSLDLSFPEAAEFLVEVPSSECIESLHPPLDLGRSLSPTDALEELSEALKDWCEEAPCLPPLDSGFSLVPAEAAGELAEILKSVCLEASHTPPFDLEVSSPPADAVDSPTVVVKAIQSRSSDSEEAFETPESTTPVKALPPPPPSPPLPQVEPEEETVTITPRIQLLSEDTGLGSTSDTVSHTDVSQADSVDESPFRPPSRSFSSTFDEDKPIASSGTYNLDFASIEVVDPFPSFPSEAGSAPRQPKVRARRKSTDSVPPPRSTLARSLSLQASDFDGSSSLGFGELGDILGTASASSTLKRVKKPRPASLKKKSGAKKSTETVVDKEPQEGGPEAGEQKSASPFNQGAEELVHSSQETEVPPVSALAPETDHPPTPPLIPETDKEPKVRSLNSSPLDPSLFAAAEPTSTNVGKVQNSPPAARKTWSPVPEPEALEVTPPDPGGEEVPAVRAQSIRLEFDYSEDLEGGEGQPARPPPKKLGKKPGARMPLRKPKAKKVLDKPDSSPVKALQDPDDVPIAKGSYTFDFDKWDDPNFNPFSSSGKMQDPSKTVAPAAYEMRADSPEDMGSPIKASAKLSSSPARAPAAFEIPASTNSGSGGDGEALSKPAKKKKTPLKTDTFRVKKSPKRTTLSDPPSQESTPLPTPETPPIIPSEDHATDEEKLASSVTNHKWTCLTVDLDSDKDGYPEPSDLSAFVNENKFISPVDDLDYGSSYEIEYMEKTGPCSQHQEEMSKKSLYLMFDGSSGSPVKSPPVRFSDSTTPGSGSSFEGTESQQSFGLKLSHPGPCLLAGSQDPSAHLSDMIKQKELDCQTPRIMSSIREMISPEEPFSSTDALLSRISHQTMTCDSLDYLEPDLAEKNPPVFAQKLQEELEFAAMRIEALKLARHISLSVHTSSDVQQQDSVAPEGGPLSRSSPYSRSTPLEAEDMKHHPYPPKGLDSALLEARKEIEQKEQEVCEWKEKYEKSRREVVEMRKIVAEYEKTIAQMIEDEHREKSVSNHTVQQLVLEKEQALSDLNSVEKSLAELFRRYEKMKEVLEGFRKNEEVLKKCAQEYLTRVKKEEQRYNALKIHAEEKLDRANSEIAQVRTKSVQEHAAYQASLRKEQLKVDALERTLEQKNKEIEELTKICDELISKMGKS